MTKKRLFFLCDNYPLTAGEFFVDDEMRVISNSFENIIIYTSSNEQRNNLNRYIPSNAEIISYSKNHLEESKIKYLFRVFSTVFLNELLYAFRHLSIKTWKQVFKIMYVDIHKAYRLCNEIENICIKKGINLSDCVFYSYWHDYRALALSILKRKYGCECIARAHGWDNFADRHKPPYLPFKTFIIKNLSNTFTISLAGKKCFEKYISPKQNDKIKVARLGKFNNRKPNNSPQIGNYLICSCSNLISLKRVNLIIDLLSEMELKGIRWVHFGDGTLRKELEKYASEKLSDINFEFRGIVANDKILDFYADNYVDLFVNVSESEGIPVSIMEAMSAGIPVLATNVGGTSEIVNSENGFLVDADFDVQKVAKTIEKYLLSGNESVKTYRQNAYNFWKENYEAGKNYSDFGEMLMRL